MVHSIASQLTSSSGQQQPSSNQPVMSLTPQQGQQQLICPVQSQQTIRQCAQELRTLGVFNQNQGEIDALTWEQIRRRSRQYFTQICE